MKSTITDSRKKLHGIWQEVNRTEEDVAKEQLAATGDVTAPVSNLTELLVSGYFNFLNVFTAVFNFVIKGDI